MPEHSIEMESPPRVVLNSDVTFHVRSDDELLGHLEVSRGALEWRPSRASVNVCSVSWERFDAIMKAQRDGRLQIV